MSFRHWREGFTVCDGDRAENVLFAQAHEARHLTARLSVLERTVKMHFRGRKNRGAGAPLADDDRQSLGADYCCNFTRALEAADVREFYFDQVRSLFLEHQQRIFR